MVVKRTKVAAARLNEEENKLLNLLALRTGIGRAAILRTAFLEYAERQGYSLGQVKGS